MNKTAAAALLLLLTFTMPARAWGPEGHSIVAMIAEAKMAPATKAKMRSILFGAPLVTAAIFADEYRQAHTETARWHFVDIPFGRDTYDAAADCSVTYQGGDCAIAEILRVENALTDPSVGDPTKKMDREYVQADALKMLVHLVGDLHQPFHTIERTMQYGEAKGLSDNGGNRLKVHFLKIPADKIATNLHSVWDNDLILNTKLSAEDYVDHLVKDVIPGLSATETNNLDPIAWAEQSHGLAKAAYVSEGVDKDHIPVLDQAYCDQQIKVVDHQLALAGVRLAKVLDELATKIPN